ncbi:MAG: hypothetical protein J5806_12250 [Lentisphaeria bacterium]|nr:hypothetical protein [Lentisphaeria bacterium]
MKNVIIPRNTRGSIMEEPFYFAPGGPPKDLPQEELKRRKALVIKLHEECKDWHPEKNNTSR